MTMRWYGLPKAVIRMKARAAELQAVEEEQEEQCEIHSRLIPIPRGLAQAMGLVPRDDNDEPPKRSH